MENRKFLFYLLYSALIEIREEAYNIGNKKIFRLSDYLHNLPLVLENRGESEHQIEEIVQELEELAKHDGLINWINQIKESLGAH
ncbi:hypothetical protein [Adhaeribacter rhizoryzae]|uniref:Uncharacterized protein n=1 Tax=Adhaeribacter rhizoryzae TaxID=2607907 RepID=A0A5M6CUX3_9BACT|nr:hypothetical protein [Adhaeribacter rhizoryzae]KAA5539048.1 hypothetical protein F0145_25255 [Adhaeribacter rhizoryzae]